MRIELATPITTDIPQTVIGMMRSDMKQRDISFQDMLVHMWFVKNGEHENVSAVLAYLSTGDDLIWLHEWWHSDMGTLVRVEYETISNAGRIIFEEG